MSAFVLSRQISNEVCLGGCLGGDGGPVAQRISRASESEEFWNVPGLRLS
jgi:hypothetical protein